MRREVVRRSKDSQGGRMLPKILGADPVHRECAMEGRSIRHPDAFGRFAREAALCEMLRPDREVSQVLDAAEIRFASEVF